RTRTAFRPAPRAAPAASRGPRDFAPPARPRALPAPFGPPAIPLAFRSCARASHLPPVELPTAVIPQNQSDRRHARRVLVVTAQPGRRAGVLVAALRGAIEQGVVGHRELQ